MRRTLLLSTLFAGLVSAAAAGSSATDLLERITFVDEALARWDMAEADHAAARLLEVHPGSPEALVAAARVAFHHSDYEETHRLAVAAAEAAARDPAAEAMTSGFLGYVDERMEFWERFEEHRSETFLLRVTERDRILVPYALSALEASARALYEDLGFCPTEPVVVEIYPNRASFIAASTLTRDEVETSGTVAICHFNRLMLLSPAVMSRGYDWLDTICHEYVHYAVYHLGHDDVPVWLHEGIAKVLESRWRLDEPEALDPRLSSVLAEGRETGRWVTFEEMHPSMAKLPSAALVGLAFAEVASGIEMLRAEGGRRAIADLITAVHDLGGDLDAALGRTRGVDLLGFEKRVRKYVERADLYRIPGVRSFEALDELPFEFAPEGGGGEAGGEDEVRRTIEDREARDWTLLGDRLKGRGHHEAAVIEYEKALERLGHSEPLVVNRMALALLEQDRIDEALPLLEGLLRDHPTLTTTLDNLSELHLRLADRAERTGAAASAEAHLEQALLLARRSESVNPFNFDVHVRLVSLQRRLGLLDEAEASRERLRILSELN